METEEAPRRSSKVMIAETPTAAVPKPVIETFKKSLLKSTSSSSSVNKPTVLHVKATEVKPPSPIPEDLVGEEISKQSTLFVTSDQEKKVEEKENAQEQRQDKDEETSERETLKEQKKEETVKNKNKQQQSENVEENNSDNIRQKTLEIDKEIDTEEYAESDAKERKLEVLPIQTTKLRGKSKATGQVMGGWI